MYKKNRYRGDDVYIGKKIMYITYIIMSTLFSMNYCTLTWNYCKS